MAANKIPSHHTEDVLQEIRTRKAEVKSQIKESADYIKTTTHKLFTPPPQATSKLGSFMNMVDQGIAEYRLPKKPFHKIAGKKHYCQYRYDPPPTLGFCKKPLHLSVRALKHSLC